MKAIGRMLGALVRLVLFPFKVLGRSVLAAFGLGVRAGRAPFRLGRAVGGVLGFRGVLFGAFGLALGLLFAPVPGRQLRAKLLQLVQSIQAGPAVPDDELNERVVFELAHAPRTWHLEPQPQVSVIAGRVLLAGDVRDDDARDEFARVTAGVPGVVAVDNQLTLAGAPA